MRRVTLQAKKTSTRPEYHARTHPAKDLNISVSGASNLGMLMR